MRSNIVFVLLLIAPLLVRAQVKDTIQYDKQNHSPAKKDEQEDLVDLYRKLVHKNISDRKYTYENKHEVNKPHLSLLPAVGYTLSTGFAGVVSGNLAFYASDSSTQKISSIYGSIAYTQLHQTIFPIHSNFWTKGNKYNIVNEWRYMKYPSSTFGLGGSTLLKSGYNIDFSDLKFHQTVYRSVSNYFYLGIGYFLDYFWNIKEKNPPAEVRTDFEKYGGGPSEIASGVVFRLLYDSRLNQINPNNGFYANIVYRPNYTFLGSDNNWQSLLLEFKKYLKLRRNSKNILALWSYNWLTTGGNPPYLMLPSTGWDDLFNTGRGYIQGRFRDKNMIYLEAEYRFGITNNGLLGGVVFVNTESFASGVNKELLNTSPAFGAGLRVKLNKFSGANLCIDYGFGIDGSKGFFVNLGEVF